MHLITRNNIYKNKRITQSTLLKALYLDFRTRKMEVGLSTSPALSLPPKRREFCTHCDPGLWGDHAQQAVSRVCHEPVWPVNHNTSSTWSLFLLRGIDFAIGWLHTLSTALRYAVISPFLGRYHDWDIKFILSYFFWPWNLGQPHILLFYFLPASPG